MNNFLQDQIDQQLRKNYYFLIKKQIADKSKNFTSQDIYHKIHDEAFLIARDNEFRDRFLIHTELIERINSTKK